MAAKLVIKMLHFFRRKSLVFRIATITKMFKEMVNRQVTAATAIAS